MTSLSLCMIVRDEADLLPDFLERVRGLWDELCVVDTGSKDGSANLLRAAGARVLHHPWRDDFAMARNVGLDAATGDWILCLDADEMVDGAFVTSMRTLVERADVGAVTVPMRNRLPDGHVREAALLRAWRRDPSIRYRYAIHEEVASTVRAFLGREGLRLAAAAGSIDHLGYEPARAAKKQKKERDVRLLRACLALDPSDLYSWFKLLEAARFWDDQALLQESARAVWPILEAHPALLFKAPFAGELLVLAADGLSATTDQQDRRRLLETWRDRIPPSAALCLRLGELREACGDAGGARACFVACLGLGDQTSHRQLASVRPRMGLARLALAAGEFAEAWQQTQLALTETPRDPEAVFAAASICRTVGGPAGLHEFARAYREKYGPHPSLQQAMAELGPVN